MDSFLGLDPTLPIDLDGSSNPDFLPDVTGNHLEYADGSVPMLAKSNGRMSPVRARTMKEYDQINLDVQCLMEVRGLVKLTKHIAELKKENFSLKLRIYFLEERMQQKFGSEEDVFKTNIELKVEVESQKRELMDKHELIQKASSAMESLTSKHNQDLNNLASQYEARLERLREETERENQQYGQKSIEELKVAHDTIEKLKDQLEGEIEHGKNNLQQIQELKDELDNKKRVIGSLNEDHDKQKDQLSSLEQELKQTSAKSKEMSNSVSRLQTELNRKERDIHRLSSAFRDTSILDSESILAPSHVQDVVDDQKETIKKLTKENQNLKSQIDEKVDTVGKLEVLMKIMKDRIQELENNLKENENKVKSTSEQNKVAVKMLHGLQCKNDELTGELNKNKDEVENLKEEIHKINVEKHEAQATKHEELITKDDKIGQLEQTIQEHEQRLENLMRSLGKKDGELVNFKQLLSTAHNALKQSEDAVEILQDEILKEKEQTQESQVQQTSYYQNLLDDIERRLQDKDVLLQQMTERLDTKDKQLRDCMQCKQDKNSTQDDLIKKMEERLKKKDEEIESLENENEQKDENIKELSKTLQAFQGAWEENEQGNEIDGMSQDMNRLKRDIAELKEQQKEKPAQENMTSNIVPELFKLLEEQLKELHFLSESLKREHQVFITLNARDGQNGGSTDHSAVIPTDLGAVQTLAQQLEDGVLRNNNLRLLLEHQVKTSVGSTPFDVNLDQEFLSQGRTQSLLVFDKAVETNPCCHIIDDDNVRYISTQTSPFSHTRSAIHTQTSPRYQHSEPVLPQSRTSYDGSPCMKQRHESSFAGSPDLRQSLPPETQQMYLDVETREGFILESEAIANMTSTMLRKLVSQLQEDLVSALKQNHQLQQHIYGIRSDSDQSLTNIQHLQQQASYLKESLAKNVNENHILRMHMGLEKEAELDYTVLPKLCDLQNEVFKLHMKLKEVHNVNNLLKEQINLITQSEDSPSGFNPDLILDMAGEIEKLKCEREAYCEMLSRYQSQIDCGGSTSQTSMQDVSVQVSPSVSSIPKLKLIHSSDEVDTTLPSSDNAVTNQSVKSSRIPRLKSQSYLTNIQPVVSNSSHGSYPMIVQRQLQDAQEQMNQLKSKLSATEETVRYQTQKMKYYKKLLQDAGLGLLDSRSQSDACLAKLGSKSFHASFECLYSPKLNKSVAATESPTTNSLSPPVDFSMKRTFSQGSIAQASNISECGVQQKISNLQEQLEVIKYENTELQEKLKVFQQCSSVEGENVEVMSLRRQFEDGQKSNTALQQHIQELTSFISELIKLNSNSLEESVVHSNMSNIQEYLNESLDVLKHGSSEGSNSAIHEKYCKALHQVQQLQEHQKQMQHVEQDRNQKLGPAECPSLVLTRQIGYKGHTESDTDSMRSTSPSDGRPKLSPTGKHLLTMKRTPVTRESQSVESDLVVVYKQTDENYGLPVLSPVSDSCIENIRHRLASGNTAIGSEQLTSLSGLDKMLRRYANGSMDGSNSVGAIHSEKDNMFSNSHRISGNGDSNFKPREAIFSGVNTDESVLGNESRLYSSHYSSKYEFSQLYDSTLNALDKRHDEVRDLVDSVGTGGKSVNDIHSDLSSSQELSKSSEVKHLQSRLNIVEKMNQTLRDELGIYETLCTSIAQDKDRSQSELPADSFSQNDTLNLKEHLAEIRALRLKLEKSLMDNERLNEWLKMHQQPVVVHDECELRLKKLQSVINSLRLELSQREGSSSAYHSQLEIKLSDLQTHINILYTELEQKTQDCSLQQKQQEEKISELLNQIKILQSQLSQKEMSYGVEQKQYKTTLSELQNRLQTLQDELARNERSASSCQKQMDSKINEQQKLIKSLQNELKQRENIIGEKEQMIHECNVCIEKHELEKAEKDIEISKREKYVCDVEQKCQKMELHLKKATKEIKRLQTDICSLSEQAEEKNKLNQTLKLELSVHERLQNDSTGKNDNKSDIRELLTEVRHLRVQLEKAIDTNNKLKQTIENLLKQQFDQRKTSQTRNESPTGSLTTDATDGRPSPDPHHSQSKKQSRKERCTKISTSEQISETYSGNGVIYEDGAASDPCEWHSSDSITHDVISHGQPTYVTSSENAWITSSQSPTATGLDEGYLAPRKHLASVENIRYWFDTYPSHKDTPKVLIDSDIRQLFAIGKLDDFEKIRKENKLSQETRCGMEARIKERIRRMKQLSTSESVEYSTLKELAMNLEHLSICLDEENRLLAGFRISELPPINARGDFFDSKLASENDGLKRELVRIKSKYDFANRMIKSTEVRLHATNKRRENMEHAMYKQLSKTAKVLGEASSNLQRNAKGAEYSSKR